MNKIFNNSILEELYESKREETSDRIINNSKEYKNKIKELENNIKQILNYVPGDLYESMEEEINNSLFEYASYLEGFWTLQYYKVGFCDGLKLKQETEKSLEELTNG